METAKLQFSFLHEHNYHDNKYHGNNHHDNKYHGNNYHDNKYHGNNCHGNNCHGNNYHGNNITCSIFGASVYVFVFAPLNSSFVGGGVKGDSSP